MTQLRFPVALSGLLLALLGGCTTMIRVHTQPRERPIRVSGSLPVALQPVEFAIPEGTVVGGHAANPSRVYQLVHTWGDTFDVDRMEFNFPLRDELSSNGYRFSVAGRAPYRLTARITRLVYNLFGDDPRVGWTEAEVEVEWTLEGAHTLRFVTSGSAESRPHSLSSLFEAFRNALRAFLAKPQVATALAPTGTSAPQIAVRGLPRRNGPQKGGQATQRVINRPAPALQPVAVTPVAPALQPVAVTPVGPAPAPLAAGLRVIVAPSIPGSALSDEALLARARAGVVTVLSGDGWASGTVLTVGGLIVTTRAAVGDGDDPIKVVSANGTERSASIVMSDASAGLALLKATGGVWTPLPMRLAAPTPGTAALAVGTPFHPALSFSVSRGKVIGNTAGRVRTDIRVSGGNAGGPLLDSRGRVIGVVLWPEGQAKPSAPARAVGSKVVFERLRLTYGR